MNPLRLLPLLAVAGAAFAVYASLRGPGSEVTSAKTGASNLPPSAAPLFDRIISGAGLVEPLGEAVSLGAPQAGIVAAVLVASGDVVPAGTPLLRLDDRRERSQLANARAALAQAEARLQRLRALPRHEDLPLAEARLAATTATQQDAADRLQRAESAAAVVSDDDRARRRFALAGATAAAAESAAALALLKAGPWASDITVAEADVAAAAAQVAAAQVEVDRLTVTSPAALTVLRIAVRAGEYALPGTPLMTLGDVSTLVVRADIDEEDAARFRAGAPATAARRSDPGTRVRLSFLRSEPQVTPKRSLTGISGERVDTRVLQVLYRLDPPPAGSEPFRVGQQLDVQIEDRSVGLSATTASTPLAP